jgi:hypothetical protein
MNKEQDRAGRTYDSYEAFRVQFYDRERSEREDTKFSVSFGKSLAKSILQEQSSEGESSH